MKDKYFDQLMRQALTPQISPSELKFRGMQREEQTIMYKKMNAKRVVIIALAACLAIGGSCFAASQIAEYRSSATPGEYTSYSQMAKAEQKVGYAVHSVETFANGFMFDNMSVKKTAAMDESGNETESAKGYSVTYLDDTGRMVSLDARKLMAGETENDVDASIAKKNVSGIEVDGYCATYKFVPSDYELTEEDKVNMERPDYEISYGADAVEEMEIRSVSWTQEGIRYILMDPGTGVELEELFSMAQELIEK